MSTKNTNKLNVPQARAAMDKFKMEAASEVGVNLKEGYNGDLTSREAGSVGGQMVKKMIESYEKNLLPYTHNKTDAAAAASVLLWSSEGGGCGFLGQSTIVWVISSGVMRYTAPPRGSSAASTAPRP